MSRAPLPSDAFSRWLSTGCGERRCGSRDGLFDFVRANRTLIRALEHRGPYAYYANAASRFWIDELARRFAAARPGDDAEYLAHALFTALCADVIDYLVTTRDMPSDRIRAGLHRLAAVSPDGCPSRIGARGRSSGGADRITLIPCTAITATT